MDVRESWKQYLRGCLEDIRAVLDDPSYNHEGVQAALRERMVQLTEWLEDEE